MEFNNFFTCLTFENGLIRQLRKINNPFELRLVRIRQKSSITLRWLKINLTTQQMHFLNYKIKHICRFRESISSLIEVVNVKSYEYLKPELIPEQIHIRKITPKTCPLVVDKHRQTRFALL